MPDALQLGIGSTVWVFDQNRREYRRDANGRSFGGPIRLEQWREQTITGENRASWILSGGRKMAKRQIPPLRINADDYGAPRVLLSRQEVEEEAWAYDNRNAISDLVRDAEFATLRKIADLIGYTEGK